MDDWLSNQLDLYQNHEQPRYNAYADFLKSVLGRALDSIAPSAIAESRPKAPASFAEKCIRKRHKYPEPVLELTDLCGGRVILETREEVNRVCKFIRRHFTIDEANSENVLDRLRSDQFGYRSVHFVVQVPETFGELLELTDVEQKWLKQINGGDKKVPAHQRKAEIQVRTRLQHIWADTFHDRMYKTKFRIPDEYQREASRLAALMETADNGFGILMERLDAFQVNFGAYMKPAEMDHEITTLSTILNSGTVSKNRSGLALKIARIAKAAGRWSTIVQTLEEFIDVDSSDQDKVRIEYGYALCRDHEDNPRGDIFRQGQQQLRQAGMPDASIDETGTGVVQRDEIRALALAQLAWSHKKARRGDYLRKTRELYRQAYLLDADNPYYFKEFLVCEVQDRRNIQFIELLLPQIRKSIATCEQHARVGIELPYAYLTAAMLRLFLRQPHEAMLAYTKAIVNSSTDYAIAEELSSIADLHEFVSEDVPDLARELECIRKLLVLGILAGDFEKSGTTDDAASATFRESTQRLVEKTSAGDESVDDPSVLKRNPMELSNPVVIVSGSADPSQEEQVQPNFELLKRAFVDFPGTVISGGTISGIPGMLGQIAREQQDLDAHQFTLLGYIPRRLPHDASKDRRYTKLYTTSGDDFSWLEPLQNWIDILGAGIDPSEVRVLGIGGGKISEFEYQLALTMGATVGLVADSGRKAGELLEENAWCQSGRLLKLPNDAMSIRAFLYSGDADWRRTELEPAARLVHSNYLASTKPREPSLQPWDKLDDDLKRSCFHQVLFAENVLRVAGLATRRRNKDDIELFGLEAYLKKMKLVDELAEMEHGRWNVERLLQGWNHHDGEKDVNAKRSPCIVPWDKLDEEIRKYDVRAVIELPVVLKEAGLEVYKPEERQLD